jgi:hypothetical protein
VLEVALEVEDDGTPAYRSIGISVPRQSGKSVLLLLGLLHACLTVPDARVVYTAQTGWDARRKVLEDYWPLIRRSRLRRLVQRVYRSASDAAILFSEDAGGSRLEHMASVQDAGHGRTIDAAAIDEAWADPDDRREAALVPAMATKRHARLWIASSAGTQDSAYWERVVSAGRHAASAGETSGICYFEWSCPPDTESDDEEAWWAHHPGLADGLIPIEVVRHARRTMEEAEFRRAFLNLPTSALEERVIPAALWEACCSLQARAAEPLRFAADAMPDRSRAAIVVYGGGVAELIDARDGVTWVGPELVRLAQRYRAPVVLDRQGPLAGLVLDLGMAGVRVIELGTAEVAAAAARTLDAIADAKLKVRSSSVLDAAAAAVRKRPVGDRWLWSRQASDADVSPFVALSLAVGAPEEERRRVLLAVT